MGWPALLAVWLLLGVGCSAVQTPTGRLLRRSAQPAHRRTLFAAQFALSHACWLATSPLAGWPGSVVGMPATMAMFGTLTLAGFVAAPQLWPAEDPEVLEHGHPELPAGHPPFLEHGGHGHAHAYTSDDLHHGWPLQPSTSRA